MPRLLTPHRRTDWAEEEDEDSLQLPQQQIVKNKDGTETIITFSIREDGKKIKTTRRIKKTVIKTTVNPRVAERKHWEKFGQDKGKPIGPQTDTTSVAENIVFRPVANWKASTEDKSEADKKKQDALKASKIKCRICSGDHFTTKCPFKGTMGEEEVAPAEMPDDAPQAGAAGTGSGSYVPPHLRGRGGAGEKMGGKFERDDLATLRVTNVSEFAEEQDLREMFSRFGHVTRVFLAKDRETGRAKGFAFVSYADRSDAAKACEKMDGCECALPQILDVTNLAQLVTAILSCVSNSPRNLVTEWSGTNIANGGGGFGTMTILVGSGSHCMAFGALMDDRISDMLPLLKGFRGTFILLKSTSKGLGRSFQQRLVSALH